MTDRELLESMSAQMGELVRHVAEVRQSNFTMQAQLNEMQADMKVMRADINALRSDVDALRSDVDALRADVDGMQVRLHNLETKIDERPEFLGGKIDHFIGVFHGEIVRDGTRFEEDRYVRDAL